jgi:hypothetical protein
MPESVTLDLPLPPAPNGNPRARALLRQDWQSRCDMAALVQLAGVQCIDGQFELSITLQPSNNGAQLQSPVNDLVAYLRERELVHSAGPAHLRRLVLAWAPSADEAPAGARLELRELHSSA